MNENINMDSTIAGPMNAHCESVNMTSEVSEQRFTSYTRNVSTSG